MDKFEKLLADLIRTQHYTQSVPSGKSYYFNNVPPAIVVFSIPANKNISKFLGCENVLELSRLWAPDGHEKNLLTRAISEAVKALRQLEPDVDALVSYADPNVGHKGFVYKAASWIPLGRSEEARMYKNAGGQIRARRSSHQGARSMTKREIQCAGYKEIKLLGKFRYARGLTKKLEKLSLSWLLTRAVPRSIFDHSVNRREPMTKINGFQVEEHGSGYAVTIRLNVGREELGDNCWIKRVFDCLKTGGELFEQGSATSVSSSGDDTPGKLPSADEAPARRRQGSRDPGEREALAETKGENLTDASPAGRRGRRVLTPAPAAEAKSRSELTDADLAKAASEAAREVGAARVMALLEGKFKVLKVNQLQGGDRQAFIDAVVALHA